MRRDNGASSDHTMDSSQEVDVESVDDDDEDAGRESNESMPVSAGSIQRKKKTRTVFSRHQVSQLEMTFDLKRYLSSQERAKLASSLRLSETQVLFHYSLSYSCQF